MDSPSFRDSLILFPYKIVSFQLNEREEARDLILVHVEN